MCCIGSLMLNMLGDFPNSHKKLRSIMTSKTMSIPMPVRIPIQDSHSGTPVPWQFAESMYIPAYALFSDFDYPAQKLLKESD